jgi:hypothetical protein
MGPDGGLLEAEKRLDQTLYRNCQAVKNATLNASTVHRIDGSTSEKLTG